MKRIKILLIMLLIGTVLNAESQAEKDLKSIFPLAENWTLFTTDFNNYFSTKISIQNNQSPLLINYQILDSENKPIYKDIIKIPFQVNNKKCNLYIGISLFAAGFILGKWVI